MRPIIFHLPKVNSTDFAGPAEKNNVQCTLQREMYFTNGRGGDTKNAISFGLTGEV